jgi:SSS family solute:Na+ symporter
MAIMAFMGVILGMLAGSGDKACLTVLQMLHQWIAKWDYLYYWLPCWLMGLMLSSYFSAILSTADSCLMAASGNIVTDIIAKF